MAPLGAVQCRAPGGVPVAPLIVLQTGLKIFQGPRRRAMRSLERRAVGQELTFPK